MCIRDSWEGLAILVALRLYAGAGDGARWADGATAAVTVRSESKGALGATIKLASKDPRLNVIGRELALDSADGNFVVEVYEHTPGVTSKTPDWLPRMTAPGRRPGDARPAVLRDLQATPVPRRGLAWWRSTVAPADLGHGAADSPAATETRGGMK